MKKYKDTGFTYKDFDAPLDAPIKSNSLTSFIQREDSRQLNKWGFQEHTLFEWLTFTTEEIGELADAISTFEYRQGDKDNIIKEAIQTATLCLKIVKMVREQG